MAYLPLSLCISPLSPFLSCDIKERKGRSRESAYRWYHALGSFPKEERMKEKSKRERNQKRTKKRRERKKKRNAFRKLEGKNLEDK